MFARMKAPITTLLAVITLVIHSHAEWIDRFQFDAKLVARGEIWRIWTGHLTHVGWNHLVWDLLMFVVLGVACERRFQQRYLPGLLAMMAAVSGAVTCLCSDVSVYRGLSGLDTGLFVWLATTAIRDAWKESDRVAASLWAVPMLGLFGKLGYEYVTGEILFVDASDFKPLVESHLAGAVAGFALGFWHSHHRRSREATGLARVSC